MRAPKNKLGKLEIIDLEDLTYVKVYLPHGPSEANKTTTVKVPKFIVSAFGFLHEKKYLDTEGIYRKQGDSAKINDMQNCFKTGEINQDLSVFDVCVLIKRFIKSIKGGLFGPTEESIISTAFDKHGNETPRILCNFCHTLPACNYGILCYIIFQLSRVVRHSKSNKMDEKNLSIIFTPVMFQTFDRNLASKNLEAIKSDHDKLAKTFVMLIKNVSFLLELPPLFIIDKSSRRHQSQNSGKKGRPIVSISQPSAKCSTRMSTTRRPVITRPYTQHVAPSNSKKGILRAVRQRSGTAIKSLVNLVSGNKEEQYCVSGGKN